MPQQSDAHPSSRVAGLDGIRGIAIALVLFSHSTIYYVTGPLLPAGYAAGGTGVAIFFVLSGYLITSLLLSEEDRAGDITLPAFYARRALRLFPALWLYLLVVFTATLLGHLTDNPAHSLLASLLYVRNLIGHGHETDHIWTLSLEEQFYVLWPFLLTLLPRRDRTRLMIALAAITAITAWRVWATRTGAAGPGALYMRSDFRFDAPLFGCALALGIRVAPAAFAPSSPAVSAALAALGIAATIAWIASNAGPLMGLDCTVMGLLGLVLVLSQVGPQIRGHWMAHPLLAGLGRISYGVYLWQQLFMGQGTALVRMFPLNILVTLAVAKASYRWLEMPFLRLKDTRFGRRKTPASADDALERS